MYGTAIGLCCTRRGRSSAAEHRHVAGQLLTPVFPEAVPLVAFHALICRSDVVDIALLARRGRLRAVLSGVQQAELVEHDVDGPEVDGDVMHHQEQDMLLRSAPQQRQPEAPGRFPGRTDDWPPGVATPRAQPSSGPRSWRAIRTGQRRMNELNGLPSRTA